MPRKSTDKLLRPKTWIETSEELSIVGLVRTSRLTGPNSIGNAKEAGMGQDLGLSSSDYALAVSIFFIGYLLLEVPSNMILSRTRPSLYLPGLMVCFLVSGIPSTHPS